MVNILLLAKIYSFNLDEYEKFLVIKDINNNVYQIIDAFK